MTAQAEPATLTAASLAVRWRNMSLYVRAVVVNTAVLLVAVAVLVLTPATVSFPISARQILVLTAGAVVMVVANAAVLRKSFRALDELVRRMETLDVLQPRERLPEIGGAETRALIAGFNTMLQRLEVERRSSTRRALSSLEDERRRIGQELHDEIGQRLTGTLLQLGRIHDEAPAELRARIVAVQDQQRATLDEVGALAWQLRPGILDDLGLTSAIDALAGSFEESGGVQINTTLPAAPLQLPAEVELVVYRIAQEALTNAVRHSGTRVFDIALDGGGNGVTLLVTDRGRGMTGDSVEAAGIRGMRERALLVDGRLRIDSPPGGGVTVRFEVPATPLTG
jgi:two-component system sensor histidine kinase UhpB